MSAVNLEINSGVLGSPAIRTEVNQLTVQAAETLLPYEQWTALCDRERIQYENDAITALFATRDPGYQAEVQRVAASLPPMPPEQRISIVAPAYNETENLGNLLTSIEQQLADIDPKLWGSTIVLNCPMEEDGSVLPANRRQIEASSAIIDAFREAHPELNINYVIATPPRPRACTATARMIGNETEMARSLMRDPEQRTGTAYIVAIDADTPALYRTFLRTIVDNIQQDGGVKDFYRMRGTFTDEDRIRYPLLNVVEMMWNETTSEIAQVTRSPWTITRGVAFSMYQHAATGGVLPIKYKYGNDEDLRIGLNIRRHRADSSTFGDIDTPMFTQNSRRETLVVGDLLRTLQEEGPAMTRRLHDIATLLDSYLDFNNTLIRGQNSPAMESDLWLSSQEEFEAAIQPAAVEVMANSWLELIRTEVALELTHDNPTPAFGRVRRIYDVFWKGRITYPVMRTTFNKMEAELMEVPEFREIQAQAFAIAIERMNSILVRNGIETEVSEANPVAPGREKNDPMQAPIRVVSLENYRQKLTNELRRA